MSKNQKFDQAYLSALAFDNMREFFSLFAVSVQHKQAGYLIKSRVKQPYFQGVYPDAACFDGFEALLDEALQLLKEEQFTCWLSDGCDDRFIECLREKHYIAQPVFMAMYKHLAQIDGEIDEQSSVEVRQVRHKSEFSHWIKVYASCFGFSHSFIEEIGNTLLDVIYQDNLMHFVGYENDNPIACGSLFIDSQQIGGLYNLGVISEYRGRGIGTLIQKIRLKKALSMNVKKVVVQAADSSKNILLKQGFQVFGCFAPYQ